MGRKKGWKKTQDTIDDRNFCRYCQYPLADHRPDISSNGLDDLVRKDMKTGMILCRFPNTFEGKRQANLGLYKDRQSTELKRDLDEYQKDLDTPKRYEGS